MYQVVFFDCNCEETLVKELFESHSEADTWADECRYDYDDIRINENGDDEWFTKTKYYNPEDNCGDYTNYEIREII